MSDSNPCPRYSIFLRNQLVRQLVFSVFAIVFSLQQLKNNSELIISPKTTFSPLRCGIRLSLCRTSTIFLHFKNSFYISFVQILLSLHRSTWKYCIHFGIAHWACILKKTHFSPFLQYPDETHFYSPPLPVSFPSPTLKDSASPSKRTSVSSFQSTVDSDSAASISLNVELDNVNFHIKKPSKYPHVPPHPADQKGRR